jgi:hypothetical protein
MKKILLSSIIFILLISCGESKSKVILLCDKLIYVVSKNGDKLTKEAHTIKLSDSESEVEAETFNLVFKDDRIYIFSLVKHPYARFFVLDRNTLELFFRLYYLDERFLFGKIQPKPPTDIKVLLEQIYEKNIVKQCSIMKKKI